MQRLRPLLRTGILHTKFRELSTPRFASTKPPPNPPPPPPHTPKRIHVVDRAGRAVLFYYVLFILGHTFLNYVYSCDSAWGVSMLPTIDMAGTFVFTSHRHRRGRDIHVGDVVSFKHPLFDGEHMIKRVVGWEGDLVLMNTPGNSDAMIQIPEGHCWVVGDNVKHSRDSRTFGPLPLALIRGKVVATYAWDERGPTFTWLEHGLNAPEEEQEVD